MENKERTSLLEYEKPPWVFKGSALYQLHLVKAETARAFIPKDFKLVEAFGYTLGGFFLANYEDSPAGIFDELVVIAGTVWNPPASCAWAAKVLVNSDKACLHGRKDVGLPSQLANFTKSITPLPETKKGGFGRFLSKISTNSSSTLKNCIDIQVKEMNNHSSINVCSINLSPAVMTNPQNDSKKWMGPAIKMSLPSFSGRTTYNPHLLKYSCQIECRLRVVPAARISGPAPSTFDKADKDTNGDYQRNLSIAVMLSKPILALEFNSLKMTVEAPTVVSQ